MLVVLSQLVLNIIVHLPFHTHRRFLAYIFCLVLNHMSCNIGISSFSPFYTFYDSVFYTCLCIRRSENISSQFYIVIICCVFYYNNFSVYYCYKYWYEIASKRYYSLWWCMLLLWCAKWKDFIVPVIFQINLVIIPLVLVCHFLHLPIF